jgi:hypothetical protein
MQSPLSAAPMSKEIVDSTRHTPAGESPRNALSVAHLPATTNVLSSSTPVQFQSAKLETVPVPLIVPARRSRRRNKGERAKYVVLVSDVMGEGVAVFFCIS